MSGEIAAGEACGVERCEGGRGEAATELLRWASAGSGGRGRSAGVVHIAQCNGPSIAITAILAINQWEQHPAISLHYS